MIKPDCASINALAKDYKTIPILREIHADTITPITLLRKIASISKDHFLLESVEGGKQWGRYSFLGYDPVMRVYGRENRVVIEKEDKTEEILTNKPYDILRKIQDNYKAPEIADMPPFTGGLVGYFSYAMFSLAEPTLKIKRGDFNDFELMLYDKVIAYDHLKQKISVIVNISTDKIMENYGKATAEIERIIGLITDTRILPNIKSEKAVNFKCNVSKEEYCQLVEKTKDYIREGDIFQAVISRQFTTNYNSSLINAYRVLRTTNPSPYMVYINMGETEIICSSPETLIQLRKGRLVTFPVAGSRPRGSNSEEDTLLEKELLCDEKELAEHNMLVDLARNDLGKISEFSSVEVTEYKMIHKYSTIMHICSRVEGNILSNCNGYSAIESILPAGTLSGAPKIRACEIINELESEPRGIYGGALGYFDFKGNMDTCIAIRMAVKKNNKVYVQAGGGIVADSIPEKEYEESGNKALAVMNAINKASEVDDL